MLRQFWNTLAKYFWGIGSKGGSSIKYLLRNQNYPLPLFLDLPTHYYLKFSTSPALFNNL